MALCSTIAGLLSPEKLDGVLALIGGFSLHLTLGTLYCFGNLTSYMTSYLRQHVHPTIQYSDMIWIPTLATISQVYSAADLHHLLVYRRRETFFHKMSLRNYLRQSLFLDKAVLFRQKSSK